MTAERRATLDAYAEELSSAVGLVENRVVNRIDEFIDLLWPDCPTARQMLAGASRLIVSPPRQLHALPIGALSVDGSYVIRRWALRFAPNLTTLLTGGGDPRLETRALVVGVERYDVPDTPLSDLKSASAECADIKQTYVDASWEVNLLIGADATESALVEAARHRPAVAHFACHGKSVEADTPLESRLYLERSILDGLEIPLMGLSPRTVVLSACSAGQRATRGRGMTELPGDDLHGLQSAFFAGGAAEIVGALFPGDDEPARTICVEFHRRRVAGDPADIALAIAVRRFLKNGNRLETGRKYWAPFFLTAVGPNAPLVPGRENHQRRET